MEDSNRNYYNRMNRFSEKLDRIEKKVDDNERTVNVIARVFWILLTTTSAALVAGYFNLIGL